MSTRQFVSVEIEDLNFGIDILMVKEINKKLDLTPAHNVPDYVIGTSNLRGQLITILDIGIRFGHDYRSITDSSGVVVIKTEDDLSYLHNAGILKAHSIDDNVGILVDKIGDIIEIDDRDIVPIPANFKKVESRFVQGLYQRNEDLLVLLNLKEVLIMEMEKIA